MRSCLHGEQEIKSSNTEKEYMEQTYAGTCWSYVSKLSLQVGENVKCMSWSGG